MTSRMALLWGEMAVEITSRLYFTQLILVSSSVGLLQILPSYCRRGPLIGLKLV